MTDTTATITKPEDIRPFKVDAEAFWQVERMAGGDGYDVMDVAGKHKWVPVSGWGRDGWDFLEWPYYVGYVRNTPEGFEFATNCEGDVDVWRFPTRELREQAMDLWAFLNWERKSESWVKGATPEAIPAYLRGPYSWDRYETDTRSGVTFPAGSTIYAIDERGATFVTATPEDQAAFAAAETRRGASDVVTFTCTAPVSMTVDDAVEYACTRGPDPEQTSDADVLREIGMDEAAEDLDRELGGNF